MMKQAIKKAINESNSKWKATKIWSITTDTYLSGETVMTIEIAVKKKLNQTNP